MGMSTQISAKNCPRNRYIRFSNEVTFNYYSFLLEFHLLYSAGPSASNFDLAIDLFSSKNSNKMSHIGKQYVLPEFSN